MKIAKISIILPSYNGEQFINEAIKSVLSQTFKNFDFYLINNGSNDNTLEIMKKYCLNDNRIKIINNYKITPKFKSVNETLNKLKYKWVSVIDDDDILFKNKYEYQINYLNKHPKIKVLSNLATYITDGVNSYGKSINQLKYQNSCFNLIQNKKNVGLTGPGVLFDKDIILKLGGFRDKFWPADDTDMWTRVAENGFVVYSNPKIFIKYRVHKSSITTSNFLLSKTKDKWVNDCLQKRLLKKKELSYDDFCETLKKKPIMYKMSLYFNNRCDYHFRSSIIYLVDKNYFFFLIKLILSFIHNPLRFFSKFSKRIIF